MGANAKKKTAAPFKGDAHALLVMIYQDQTLPLAMRLEAAKAAGGHLHDRRGGHGIGRCSPRDGCALVRPDSAARQLKLGKNVADFGYSM
jgi:hypothetical protein